MKFHLAFIVLLLISEIIYAQTTVDFKWKSAKIKDRYFPHAVMLIPVKFAKDTTTYYFQFDTGATYSSIYSQRSNKMYLNEELIQTSLGRILFRKNETMPPSQKEFVSIGTLGADFLAGKTVLIDFQNQQMQFLEFYDSKEYTFRPMKLLDGRPCFEIVVEGRFEAVLYDTGSSLFGLWTAKRNWEKIREQSKSPKTFPISSWGKINKGFSSFIDPSANLFIGNCIDEDSLQVWYVDNRKFKRFYRRNNLYGILGNQAFFDKKVLLDYENMRFGVSKDCN